MQSKEGNEIFSNWGKFEIHQAAQSI